MNAASVDGEGLERIQGLDRQGRADTVEQVVRVLEATDSEEGNPVDRATRARLEGFVTGFHLGRE